MDVTVDPVYYQLNIELGESSIETTNTEFNAKQTGLG